MDAKTQSDISAKGAFENGDVFTKAASKRPLAVHVGFFLTTSWKKRSIYRSEPYGTKVSV